MRYIKLILYFILLFFSSLAIEVDLSAYVSIGSTFIGIFSFLLSVIFAFSVYGSLMNVCNISNKEINTREKLKYQSIMVVAILIAGASFFMKTDINVIDAFVSSISLVLIIFVIDLAYKLSRSRD